MVTTHGGDHGHGWNLIRNSEAPGAFPLPAALTVTLALG